MFQKILMGQVNGNRNNSISDKFFSARIVERHNILDDLLVMQLDPGGDFPFAPGQYATLGVLTP